jgi:gas vesicle protein
MEQKPYVVGAVIGAVVGGAVGYLYFTDAGKQRRDELARLLDRMADELKEAQALWARVQRIGQQYQEGRRNALGGSFDFDGSENVQ